jgi:hypothetical protein
MIRRSGPSWQVTENWRDSDVNTDSAAADGVGVAWSRLMLRGHLVWCFWGGACRLMMYIVFCGYEARQGSNKLGGGDNGVPAVVV